VEFTFNSTLQYLPSPAFLLSEFVWINLVLAFFNLIPLPPLDGSKILYAFLPAEWVYRIQPLERFGFLILFGLVYLVPSFMNTLVVAPSLAILQFLIG
jgi:Zn-dependent protease